jgi:3-deoxy-7-phosphoheptulonate synthase
MIVVMSHGATQGQVDHVVAFLEAIDLKTHIIEGTDRTVVAAIGDKRALDKGALENAEGVEKIVPILAPYKVASKEVQVEKSCIALAKGEPGVGAKQLSIIAGPCAVEDRNQILDVAAGVKEAGATALRGGAFKPRTSPYSFQGLGEKGLEYLAEAREKTGLPIVTEVVTDSEVGLVCRYADVLQIGARNMQNYMLLKAVGEQPKPVLLKRGMSASMEEFLLAAEYIINAGNKNVILCERGIRTFETYCRNTQALSIVPAIQRVSHLPIIVDPTHGTGHAYMVESMSLAAVAIGADGIIVEVHPDPEHALTDAAQQINVKQFMQLMNRVKRVAEAVDRNV